MKITYDTNADALYIYFKKAEVLKTVEVKKDVSADLDASGDLVGIEILNASHLVSPADFSRPLEVVTV